MNDRSVGCHLSGNKLSFLQSLPADWTSSGRDVEMKRGEGREGSARGEVIEYGCESHISLRGR